MEELKNNNIKTTNGVEGVVVAEILEKQQRKTKDGRNFWILKLSIRKRLTEMYFELTGRKEFTLKTMEEPMFVFTEKARFTKTLLEGNIYFFEFKKAHRENKDYFHAEEWEKLGDDKRLIERAFRLLITREIKDEEKIEEQLTDKELLIELGKRMKAGKIEFNLEPADSEVDKILGQYENMIDAGLYDKQSKFTLDLRNKDEEENELEKE